MTNPTFILLDFYEGKVSLEEATQQLAAFPEEQFSSHGPNYEKGMPQEVVDRLIALYDAVRHLRGSGQGAS